MIGYLKGQVVYKTEAHLVLDVQGVGYEVLCQTKVLESAQLGESLEFYIYTHVREEALQLFGFKTSMEKQMFLSLIKINGVGAKVALSILSGSPLHELRTMINEEDVKGLSRLPKIGKKTAEQIILSLKGKLPREETDSPSSTREEIASALVNLGFKNIEVEEAVSKMERNISTEEGIRTGLSLLSRS